MFRGELFCLKKCDLKLVELIVKLGFFLGVFLNALLCLASF